MEMLVTVSLIVILLGISVIGIADWSKKIKMAELDNQAKIIYLEAQNQLSAMEAEGSLPKFYEDYFKAVEGGTSGAYSDRKLTVDDMPQDYDFELYKNFYLGLYYFSDEEAVASVVIPADSLSNDYGHYMMEINPVTGDLYGVFYWEDGNENITHSPKNLIIV